MFSDGTTAVAGGTVYYFKVEPLKWKILDVVDVDKALVMCENIITGNMYAGGNNIKNWLNNQFYTTTFSELQHALIDGSAGSNISLPTKEQAENSSYGFGTNESRRKQTTDYSRAVGAYMNTFDGYGHWWTCTGTGDGRFHSVKADGTFIPANIDWYKCGIIPVLTMRLGQAHKVTLNKQYDEAGTVSGGGYKLDGSSVTVTADTSHAGYYWDGWYEEGTKVSSEESWTINPLTYDRTLEVRWNKCSFMFDVWSSCSENVGTITSSAEGMLFVEYGTSVTITATAKPGFTFAGWYNWNFGELLSLNAQYTFNMPAEDLSIQARWTAPLTLTKETDEAGTVSGGGDCFCGKGTTVTAITKPGYTFDGWYNNGAKVSGNEVYHFNMPEHALTFQARWLGYQRVNQDGGANPVGAHILFGEWPQTEKDESVTIPENAEPIATGPYTGYYAGYIDGVFEGYYARVPVYDMDYYFKVEPIKWRILNANSLGDDGDIAFILCESIIANMAYDTDTDGDGGLDIESNNYKESQIRA